MNCFILREIKKTQGGWEERVTGAACLTKDYRRKSYYIQIFDMQYCQQVATCILLHLHLQLRHVNLTLC